MTATFLLLVNDHLLKALWPGLITGKLSDFAGLLVAPPLLALARLPVPAAIAVTGTGFTLVKTTEAGAALASHAWTLLAGPSRVLADPTDLVALPALAAAWLVWKRCRTEQAVRQARTLLIVPVALIAVTATSAAPSPPSATAISVDDGIIMVIGHYDAAPLVSRDGGRTWTVEQEAYGTAMALESSSRTQACLPSEPAHCYRVVPPRLAVHESRDGGRAWATAWEISPGREDVLRRYFSGEGALVGSQAVAVQERADGHVVVVANGRDGIAVRDTGGTWRRFGFAGESLSTEAAVPLHDSGVDLTAESSLGFFAGLVALLTGVAVSRRHRPPGGHLAIAAYTLTPLGLSVTAAAALGTDTVITPLLIGAGLVFGVMGGAFALATAVSARVPPWVWAGLLAVAAVTTATVWIVFSGWASGTPDDHSTAEALSWLAATAGVTASALIGWSARAPEGTAGRDPAG
ncbi:hypothetical protein ACFOWE_32340 [Planomonospora corallina]|uniref:Uncharacterized protein n=1 Tax=Planomonospora corallina TaxID=1806052 RepID=A0ABV8IIQ3_9ACTN